MKLALVDVETTGGRPHSDRIIDIGIITIDNFQKIEEWTSLVNPERHIDPFISHMTGITNEDVARAPLFEELLPDILSRLQDRIFIAHNVRFDYSFLRHEFSRAGTDWKQPHACSVRLSRALYPTYTRHSLDSLINRFNISIKDRHRALADTQVIWEFMQIAAAHHTTDKLITTISALQKTPTLPPNLPPHIIDDIPETVGVYVFKDKDNTPIYIGKSVNLHDRVLSHFSSDLNSTKELELKQFTTSIETFTTAGELDALLTESKLVKLHTPRYNHQLKPQIGHHVALISTTKDGFFKLSLKHINQIFYEDRQQIVIIAKSKHHLLATLEKIAREHRLCPKLLGLESGTGPCFGSQLGKCSGACTGKINHHLYNATLKAATARYNLKIWPFSGKKIITEHNPYSHQTIHHVFKDWVHYGSFTDLDTANSILTTDQPITMDTYHILKKFIK